MTHILNQADRNGLIILRLCELREKEVINLCTCKRLGFVEDLIFELCDGTVKAIVVPDRAKFCGIFGSEYEFVIPIECIKKIGEDFIMVEINEEKFRRGYKD